MEFQTLLPSEQKIFIRYFEKVKYMSWKNIFKNLSIKHSYNGMSPKRNVNLVAEIDK